MPTPLLHPEERVSAAPNISPGIVRNEEFLLRELYSPQDVENGKITPRAIPIGKLREGYSVHRMQHATPDFVKTAIQKRLSIERDEPWESEGGAMLKTENIRDIYCEDERAFIVRDTPGSDHPGHPGHASIHVLDPEKKDREVRKMRSILLKRLENRVSVDEAYTRTS